MEKSQIEKDNPMSWEEYEAFVGSVRYKDYRITIDPIAKRPGEVIIDYKYQAERPARPGEKYVKMIYPIKVISTRNKRPFTGFDSFDWRNQAYKKDLLKALKALP